MDWYPFYVQAYQNDTLHLTCLQDGAYRRLIDHYYATRGPIPNNDVALARIVGLPVDEWLEIACAVRPFFKVKAGKLVHSRCERELAEMSRRAEKRHNAAKKGGKAKALKSQADPAHALLNPATLTLTKKEEDLVLPQHPVLPTTTEPSTARAAAPLDPRYAEVCRKVEEILNVAFPFARQRIDGWLKFGADPEADIYPTIERLKEKWRGRDLVYFDGAIGDSLKARTNPLQPGVVRVPKFDPAAYLAAHYNDDGTRKEEAK